MERIDEAIRELEEYKELPYASDPISDETLDLCISLLKEMQEEELEHRLEKYVF